MSTLTLNLHDIELKVVVDKTPTDSDPIPMEHDHLAVMLVCQREDDAVVLDNYPGSDALVANFNLTSGNSTNLIMRPYFVRISKDDLTDSDSNGEPDGDFTVNLSIDSSSSKSKTYTLSGARPEITK